MMSSTTTIQKVDSRYEVTCNKPNHDFDFTMADTMREAKEAKSNSVNWCASCNEEFYAAKVGA
jgi:hypothetical protein